ncbi:hypothetical protein Rxyl_1189 [Rubrobacter xylanophilus DSM 9941]|uniref:Uncharacterized protein n=2 Tax=Rubrobacter xylanophilus TaxID=49319 RepID=Q1AWS3_RUBXD|nr:hypothetical protein Rxyl_1189 [Rubrobacter xylanophilus DSM 9941]
MGGSSGPARGLLLGVWSRRGELLGSIEAVGGGEAPAGLGALAAEWRNGAEELSLAALPFPGGWRIRLRESWRGAEKTLWIAPLGEEEEGCMGLFAERDLRSVFPELLEEVRDAGMGGLLHRALRGEAKRSLAGAGRVAAGG